MNTILLLMSLLILKHFVADFLFQPPYMYLNKGTYGHLGGISHVLVHNVCSGIIMIFFVEPITAFGLCLAEAIIHYHIDWAKMNINRMTGWGPLTSENFWRLLGVDQSLHYMTYVWMIWMVT